MFIINRPENSSKNQMQAESKQHQTRAVWQVFRAALKQVILLEKFDRDEQQQLATGCIYIQ